MRALCALIALCSGAVAALTCASDEIIQRGGTFQLHNQPAAQYVNSQFGYGLRVDGLFDSQGEFVVFSFDAPGAAMYLHYDIVAATIHIYGTAIGGQLNGTTVTCNQGNCVIVSPRAYQIDYHLSNVQNSGTALAVLANPGDGGFVRDAITGTTYAIVTSTMNGPGTQEFFVNIGVYRDTTTSYTGYGWVDLLNATAPLPDAHYRDWGFLIGPCVCNAVDRIFTQGGTYRLHNHPEAEYVNANFGYGLRLDGVIGNSSTLVVFDFDAPHAAMYLTYDNVAGTIHIYGSAVGGVLSGDQATCNQGNCSILNPVVYLIDYKLNHISNEGFQLVTAFYPDDGGIVASTASTTVLQIASTQMPGVGNPFLVTFGQYRGETSGVTGNGWVAALDFTPSDAHYRDWAFIIGECACQAVADLISGGGLYRAHNHPKAEYINQYFGYGLRIDGLFDDKFQSIVVFDFDNGGAAVHIKYDNVANTLHLFGIVLGGQLNGNWTTCNQGNCSIVNPRLYRIDFWWHHISNEGTQLTSQYNADDGGSLTDVVTRASYPIYTSQMGGAAEFFVDDGVYRGVYNALTGHGWVETNNSHVDYRDWGFTINECDCTPEDGLMADGGTYQLHNHPTAEFVWAGMGYGLRIDGIFDTGSTVSLTVFDFDAPGAAVFLTYDPVNSRVHIFGTVVGGKLNGSIAVCNELHCTIQNPVVYQLDYWVSTFTDTATHTIAAFYKDTDGGWLLAPNGTAYAIKGTSMPGAVFLIDIGQYRGYLLGYSGYGWVQLPTYAQPELHAPYYRDWGFVIGDCVPGYFDLCLYPSPHPKRGPAAAVSPQPHARLTAASEVAGCPRGDQCRIVNSRAECVNSPDFTTQSTEIRIITLLLKDYPPGSVALGLLIDEIEHDVLTALGLTDRWRVYVSALRNGSIIATVSFRDAPEIQLPNAVQRQPVTPGVTVDQLALQLAAQAANQDSPLYGGKITHLVDPNFRADGSLPSTSSFSLSPAGLAVIAVVGAAVLLSAILVVRHVRRHRANAAQTEGFVPTTSGMVELTSEQEESIAGFGPSKSDLTLQPLQPEPTSV